LYACRALYILYMLYPVSLVPGRSISQRLACCCLQVDQTTDPCRITLSGTPQSLHLATSMISDIVR
jgi:hypothetical protein